MNIPYDKADNYHPDIIARRQQFAAEQTGKPLEHLTNYSIDPAVLPGNVENFVGVAQVPIGLAGPLRVAGEHARGDFYVPMATTEGTLVASYNRGMKICREAGGILTTVLDDAMQRAPLFAFASARHARAFGEWVTVNFAAIKIKADETSGVGRLRDIEQYAAGKLRWLRFNYTTGDAAGQNMVTRATQHACEWILTQQPAGLEHFTMAANLDTDKKHSHLNTLHTRGKRVVAEITLPGYLLQQHLHVSAKALFF